MNVNSYRERDVGMLQLVVIMHMRILLVSVQLVFCHAKGLKMGQKSVTKKCFKNYFNGQLNLVFHV
jgi:hypothetical protein